MNIGAKVRKIVDSHGNPQPDSISCMEKVDLGGVDQWVLIRGVNMNNPVLLMVHGGPGQSEMYLSHLLHGELEKHFTVVNWDQRGAAKSYSRSVLPQTMNLKQLLSDGEELIGYLKKKLNKPNEKFLLHGHSFGTILGMLMAQKYPQYFKAYIGTAQVTGLLENLNESYDWTLRQAKEVGNEKAVKELEAIGRPPFRDFTKGLWKYSMWLAKFGGKIYQSKGTEIFKAVFSAPEYSLLDKINFFKGSLFSVKHLHKELLAINIKSSVPSVVIPVYFFLGKHDYSAPSQLAEQYMGMLNAPDKEVVWFEQSGHMPQYEENGKYVEQLIRIKNRYKFGSIFL